MDQNQVVEVQVEEIVEISTELLAQVAGGTGTIIL